MLTSISAGDYTVRGVSVGGVYTSLQVPELDLVFDVGLAPRSFAATRRLFLSHCHADHIGGLVALLGIRGLFGSPRPLELYLPEEVAPDVSSLLATASGLQRFSLDVKMIPVAAGSEHDLGKGLFVKAYRTFHPVPSLAYVVGRRVSKLRKEFKHLSGAEIGSRRKAGEDIFRSEEKLELAYATDTLVGVLDHYPELLQARVLILECTFLDARKSIQTARAGCHIHISELATRAEQFHNEHIVLMHFSQIYKPQEVRALIEAALPSLAPRIIAFVPRGSVWPG